MVNLMIIRKWMEIWIEVDEFEILNIMRWFQGDEEKNISRIFGCINVFDISCTCEPK